VPADGVEGGAEDTGDATIGDAADAAAEADEVSQEEMENVTDGPEEDAQ